MKKLSILALILASCGLMACGGKAKKVVADDNSAKPVANILPAELQKQVDEVKLEHKKEEEKKCCTKDETSKKKAKPKKKLISPKKHKIKADVKNPVSQNTEHQEVQPQDAQSTEVNHAEENQPQDSAAPAEAKTSN